MNKLLVTMSEFTTPFSTIVRKDIRHMISIFPGPGNVPSTGRRISPYPTSENSRQRSDSDLKKSVLRYHEDTTLSGNGQFLPRAPAFRSLSNDEIGPITNRVTKPTLASDYKRHYSELADAECSNTKSMNRAKELSSKFMGLRKIERNEMSDIVAQLTRPTLLSEIRHR